MAGEFFPDGCRPLGIVEAREWDSNPLWQAPSRNTRFWHDLVYPFAYPYPYELSGGVAKLLEDVKAYPPELLYFNGQAVCIQSPESHVGPWRHAQDLVLPVGTEVLAPIDGKIVALREDSEEFGTDESYASKANYITLAYRPMRDNQPTHHHIPIDCMWHMVEMVHLELGSVSSLGLKIGDWVEVGQPIGKTGCSGWMTAPHLHVVAFLMDWLPGEDPNIEGNPFGWYSQDFTFMSMAIHKERRRISYLPHIQQMGKNRRGMLYFPRPYTGVHQSPEFYEFDR